MATSAQKAALPSKGIKLPEPRLDSAISREKELCTRRSIREFTNQPLEFSQVSQMVWAAHGVTAPDAHRTAPSAGGLYALEIYVICGGNSHARRSTKLRLHKPLLSSPCLQSTRELLRSMAIAAFVTLIWNQVMQRRICCCKPSLSISARFLSVLSTMPRLSGY